MAARILGQGWGCCWWQLTGGECQRWKPVRLERDFNECERVQGGAPSLDLLFDE